MESIRRGIAPKEAAKDAIARIIRKYLEAVTGIMAINNKGKYGGAVSRWTFIYRYRGGAMNGTEVVTVPPLSA